MGTRNTVDVLDAHCLKRFLKTDYNLDKDVLPQDLEKSAAEQLKARP
nr:hypothetical protein [Pseudomonas fluorescens]